MLHLCLISPEKFEQLEVPTELFGEAAAYLKGWSDSRIGVLLFYFSSLLYLSHFYVPCDVSVISSACFMSL